ncbi:MAG: hypothetical protein EOM26_10765 [Alphaproteobacteria bacterium]|nr:hypothetical protein [Alphaproteobacteria bacterium]
MKNQSFLAASAVVLLGASPAFANDAEIDALRAELAAMRVMYESKIDGLESRLAEMEARQVESASRVEPAAGNTAPGVPATGNRRVTDNSFNPAIGVMLQGKYKAFSENEADLAGFAVGHEGERGEEGLSVEHTELNFSASVDDKFYGSTTIALAEHHGETEVELEEAFIQTLALPYGASLKGGRFFADIGYLNAHHAHSDDFADRPLPYRAFLNGAYNDDGLQASVILPSDLYAEVGAGLFRGKDFPAGGNEGSDVGSWTAFARTGGDIGDNTAWRAGASALLADVQSRAANEGNITFRGDSDLYIADVRLTFAPTGNANRQELILQGEYFWRDENGAYNDVAFDESQRGWYAQTVYKFAPQWRVGARYSELHADAVPAGLAGTALDDGGHDPWAATVMGDWTNSEFSRLRLQYSYEELANELEDNQLTIQYIMSIGAHGAHPF